MKLSTTCTLLWVTPTLSADIKTISTGVSQANLPSAPPCDGDFNSGVYLGADVAEKIWQYNGASCSTAWGFEELVDEFLEANYPTDTSDWRKNSCHEGVEKGAAQVVTKYEKQCLHDTPQECIDLGNAAAQKIAYDFCPFDAASGTSYTGYKETCRSVAYGVCEGAIYNQIQVNAQTNPNGCSVTTSELAELQAKCVGQVDSMTGGMEDEETVVTISFDDEEGDYVAAPSGNNKKKQQKKKKQKKNKSTKSCSGDFNSGVYLGADVAEEIWQKNGASCSNVWGFEDQVNDYLSSNYPTDNSDWKTNSCHEGMQKGAAQVVTKYDKQCLNDTPQECLDLGNAAAQQIAFDFCPFDAAKGYGYSDEPNYKETCRSVAYGICKGAIYTQVLANGCTMTSSQLSQEQGKCKNQVDNMTGGSVVAVTRNLRAE